MNAWDTLFDVVGCCAEVRVAPAYIGATVVIGYAVFVARRGGPSPARFLRWLFPREVYLHPSHMVDIKLFLANRALSFFGAFNAVLALTAATTLTISALSSTTFAELRAGPWSAVDMTIVTVIVALVSDFCVYWIHRLHHEVGFLWPFHAVHHSAEVLTPITLYRKHPLYDIVENNLRNIAVGLVTGLALTLISRDISMVSIGGANAVYVFFNFLGANLRHSRIWLSYGGVVEHVFISPAQHQIHHSRAPEHHMRNYGEIFAVWDWMFGTLVVADRGLEIEFGLGNAAGEHLAQPHGSFLRAILVPFRDSWRALRGVPEPDRAIGSAESRDR